MRTLAERLNDGEPLRLPKKHHCEKCGVHVEWTEESHYSGLLKARFGGGMGKKVHGLLCSELCKPCHHERDNPKSKDYTEKLESSHDQMAMMWERLIKALNDGEIEITLIKKVY